MITEVADALCAKLEEIEGLRASPVAVDVPHPPMAVVSLTDVDYHVVMGGNTAILNYRISLVCGRSNDRGGWAQLEELLDPHSDSSVRAKLLEDPTLGGVASTLGVGTAIDIGSVAQQDSSYIVASLEVEVYGVRG